MTNLNSCLGILAGTLTTISFLPQFLKVWKTKSAEDLSTAMLITFTLGVLFWLCYGLLIKDFPIIVANMVTLSLCLMIIALKWRYRSGKMH